LLIETSNGGRRWLVERNKDDETRALPRAEIKSRGVKILMERFTFSSDKSHNVCARIIFRAPRGSNEWQFRASACGLAVIKYELVTKENF
jgi:hypothetical protein